MDTSTSILLNVCRLSALRVAMELITILMIMGEYSRTRSTPANLIIATGNIDNNFARLYIAPLAKAISAEPLWLNQIEQINVLPDRGIELVPRVGNHIIFMGYLPKSNGPWKRKHDINIFVKKKLSRLEKFYRYGLSQAGWNKYSYIDIEFDNQIICKKRDEKAEKEEEDALLKKAQSEQVEDVQRTEEEERDKSP